MLYINGKPYVVRESTRPFANLEYTGAQGIRYQGMRVREACAGPRACLPTWSTQARKPQPGGWHPVCFSELSQCPHQADRAVPA